MKFWLLYIFLVEHCCYAQNLVLNGSFEREDDCGGVGGLSTVPYWDNAHGSPDSYKICAGFQPSNGFQLPYDGDCFIGEGMFMGSDGREYARGKIAPPLETGRSYFVSFKTVRANNTPTSINKIGALFTTTDYSVPVTNYAHVYTDSIITDTLNWITVSGCFTADSNYNFIVLGNFFDNAHTDHTQGLVAYYYIDDVQVYADSSCNVLIDTTTPPDTIIPSPIDTFPIDTPIIPPIIDTTHIDTTAVTPIDTFTMPSAFTPNGDNVNDVFQPVPAGLNIEAFRIYNRWGQKVFETSGANAGWDGKYKGEPQPADGYSYYIEVKFANGTIRKKTGSFTLLR